MKLNAGKSGSNSPFKYSPKKNKFFETKSNNENTFAKLMNSLYAKFKGK